VWKERGFTFDVLGATEKLGMNISSHIEERFESGSRLPVKDFSTPTPTVVERLWIEDVFTNRLNFSDPRPWQRFWYSVNVAVIDEFNMTFEA